MSYGFDLVRLPAGVDPYMAYKHKLEEQERTSEGILDLADTGPIDPRKEKLKRRLANALIAQHPTLELYKRNYLEIANTRGIDETEAHRLFRTVELNEKNLSIQLLLFDDGAGASFSFVGEAQACTRALRVLWDCLQILESEGGYSTYDSQIDRVLDLKADFETVLKYACGVDYER
jgi:hypothetical protein